MEFHQLEITRHVAMDMCIGDEGPLAKLNRFDSPPLFSHHIFFLELRKQHAESGDKRVWSMDGSILN